MKKRSAMNTGRNGKKTSCCGTSSAGLGYIYRHSIVVVILASLALLASCGRDGRLHPTDENFPQITNERHALSEDTTMGTLQLVNEADFLQTKVYSIGALEGDHHEMIGSINSMVITDSTLLYLDGENGEVRVYDHHGSLKQVVGSLGVGPGEFTHVKGMAATGDAGQFFVADQSGSRIQVFHKNAEDLYELEHAFFTSGYGASDICVMGGHVYLSGYSEDLDLVIHKLTYSGEYVTSFGQPYLADNLFVRKILSDHGSLVCSEKNRIVAYANVPVPVLKGYDEFGSLLWSVTFPDHSPMYMIETKRPSILYPDQQAGESTFLLIATDAFSDAFVVSYNTAAPPGNDGPGPADEMTRHYFSVPVVSGEGVYLGSHYLGDTSQRRRIPHIMAWGKDYVYAKGLSFPKIDILDRSRIFK
jgi:hypothetical protein